jgi:hypothetical protein
MPVKDSHTRINLVPFMINITHLTARSWWATGKKEGLCYKKIKKMAFLSSFDMPWRFKNEWLPTSSTLIYFFVFFNSKVHDLGVH